MTMRLACWMLALALLAGTARGAAMNDGNPLPDPGFEEGSGKGWSIGDEISTLTPEAAHSGKMGLRIGTPAYSARGSAVTSARLPVTPGQTLTVTFWAKGEPNHAGVFLYFYNAAGKQVTAKAAAGQAKGGGGQPARAIDKPAGQWQQYDLKAQAPEGAAFVSLWLHSYSGGRFVIDLDDFALTGLAKDAVAIAPAAARKVARKVVDPSNLPPRKSPPIIIIKLDDVKQVKGDISAPWRKVADFFKSRNLKAGFGVICDTLPEATPKYVQWIKDLHDSGLIEFWFHGWDHAPHAVNGDDLKEFSGRSYDDQLERFRKSQKLAQEKLGFAFTTFGTPGSGNGPTNDANTYRVMQDDPHMTAWLYPAPLDAPGKALAAKGKVAILDRVWQVNLESAVGVPDFQSFLQGYAANPEREYFVLQGHPWGWAGEKFDEFVKIIDFLQAQQAVFMTPSEFVAYRHHIKK